MGLLEPIKYGEQFHKLYVNNCDKRTTSDRSSNRKKKSDKRKTNKQNEQSASLIRSDQIELEPNASKFAIFSAVRSSVLESETKLSQIYGAQDVSGKSTIVTCCCHCATTCKTGVAVECRCHSGQAKSQDNNDSENDSFTDDTTEKEIVLQVPQIVGAGLRGLFELIAEARNVSPMLCTKALRALFDVIQGQIPESFKSEPSDLIQPLYDLLLELATLHGPAAQGTDATNWSAVGCSALLGLCVARGDTGKTLKAISALLMSPKVLSSQNIQLPLVLSTLQRSIYSVALGKPTKPDFFKNGIPRNSQIEQFSLKNQLPANIQYNLQPSIAANGKYVFILTGKSLIKIGSGFNGTLRGFVYAVNNEFGKEKNGWIGFCGNILFYKKLSKRSNESILIVNTDTLSITCAAQVTIPTTREGQQCLLFSDGESINAICTAKDDTLVVKQIYTTGATVSDLPLKLARKSFRTLGYASFEDEVLNQNQIQAIQTTFNQFEPKLPNDQDVVGISCGKEFGLVRSVNGKVYYYGKSASIGLKSVGKTPSLRVTELIISKVSNIVHISIGHDGIHAVLVNDDGTVYFAGTARRGEDGDTSKNRRQPKAVKPKKLAKIESHFIVHASCNNGTSAFVTKTGKLIMFGKDTAHCDSSGLVTDLLDQHITRVSLGKAHCVALNSKGQVFTFGLNNKGQCGRQKAKETTTATTASTDGGETKVQQPSVYKYDASNICDFDDHIVVQGQCRVCSICRECTGYNISCVSTQNTTLEHRIPGANCACGHGDAGCSKCGACSTCIAFQENESGQDGKEKRPFNFLIRQRSKSLISNQKDKKQDDVNHGSDVERDAPRVAPLPPQKITFASTSPVIQIACGLHHTVVLTLAGEVFTFGSNQYGQLGTSDLQPHSGPYGPVKVPGVVSQVTAGSNHTVLLTNKGVVYTFGNHQKGQLGRLPNDIQQQNSNYPDDASVRVDNSSDELPPNSSHILIQRQKYLWNCAPGAVFGIGPAYGKKATFVSASGDQTFFKIDESLITGAMLSKVNIVADKSTILLIPQFSLSFNCLAISRRDGNCNAHSLNQVDFAKIIQTNSNAITQLASDKCNQNIEINNFHQNQDRMSQSVHEARNQIFDVQENLKFSDHRKRKRPDHKSIDKIMPQLAFALDTCFGVLWVFDAISRKIMCYNVIASEINDGEGLSYLRAILSPELALPLKPDVQVTRNQASLNILACLDILTSCQDSLPNCFQQIRPRSSTSPTKESQSSDFQIVSRFENFGGGWGYSGHSVEAIRFMADTDIQLCGFAMFGGRGEYTCKLKLFDLGCDGGGYEKDGILISETDEIPYECPARSKYNIMLPKPLTGNAGKWYLVWARISGPSSDCGSSGQSTVTTEDQIVFNFKTSKKANNGTDVNSGQIPSILYRIITQETKQPTISVDLDPVYKISRFFANTVTKECFESLVQLLDWAWMSFKMTLNDLKDKKKLPQTTAALNRLFYINKACLRLLRKYTNEIYPNNVFAKVDKPHPVPATNKKSETQIYVLNQGPSTSKNIPTAKFFMGSSMEATTPTNPKKINMENLQLAESIGDVRSLLIQILSDDIPSDIDLDGYETTMDILDECHTTFLSCFNVFYPTSSLKWNCLCELLAQEEKGNYHSRLLSAIIAGLCHPNVKLRTTFSLLSSNRESRSIVSPSDNSGLPMLLSTENHQYPVLVEQMIYRTQREKSEFLTNVWTFKDVLIRLLDIISHPIKSKIENIYNRSNQYVMSFNKRINQKLIDNCCHLLARVLAEIVYQSCSSDNEMSFLPTRTLLYTSSRFARCDASRTWNTGNFGPDAISFSVNRPGIAIAGAMVYSGSGSYEYQLELLYDAIESQSQHKWETLESVSGTYDQDIVHNEMAEVKFDRPVHIKENTRYAMRLCSQGARTCSGDGGSTTVRGPCGTTFSYFPCDLSFNGTTTARGQIPCLIYYTNPVKNEAHSGKVLNELHARDTALQIATDITRKCAELLILTRNTLAASMSPSEKSLNSSNNTQTIDSEQNITPIEEHLDVTFANNSNITNTPSPFPEHNVSTARDLSKRIESFSKGIMETLKFDKRSTNPFEFEIEIGATEIHPKDLVKETEIQDKNLKNGRISKMNGNNSNIKNLLNEVGRSGSEDDSSDFNVVQTLKLFENKSASMFHTLLPLVFAHIGVLASNDPKSSVQILSLIRDILPHVSALNQLYCGKDKIIDPKDCIMQESRKENFFAKDLEEAKQHLLDLNTTSNHYCIIESDHPYKSASISNYKVEFPPCVQWFTVEFDHQCGTAQPEDYLVVSIPTKPSTNLTVNWDSGKQSMFSDGSKGLFESYHSDKFSVCKNACITSYTSLKDSENIKNVNSLEPEDDRFIVKVYNTTSQWSQNALVLPGNKIDFSLETASNYARDQLANKYGFRCLIVGYENPTLFPYPNSSLTKLECELAYLGGMCTSHLMKKDLTLPGDNPSEDFSNVEETISAHAALLSKGLAISDSVFTVNQALDSYLPIGGQSNEKQFLKDFVNAAPGSSGARLAAWLQPEPRLDPNKCELKTIQEPVRYGWPTQLSIICRDQYGDAVYIPDLKIEIKATPSGGVVNGSRKTKKTTAADHALKSTTVPPKIPYEPTIKDKMCCKAITFMKAYQQYSFEELRFFSPTQTRVSETLYAHDMGDLTFGALWTPNSVGNFCLTISIDGISLEEVYRVDVKEAGVPPPPQKPSIKKTQPPNKLRKFISKNSAGLRIRSHPTLQSEQVGVVKMDGIISFIDEVENDDGVWVRLSTESIRQHCTTGWYPSEAWCLQYNQHLGKTLLHPVIEPQTPQAKIMLARIRNSSQSSLDVNDLTIDSDDTAPPVSVPVISPNKKDFSSAKFTPPIGPSSFVFPQSAATSSFPLDSSEGTEQQHPKFDETKSDDELKTSDDHSERIDDYSSALGYIQASCSSRDDEDKRNSTQTAVSSMRNNSSGSSLSISPNQSNIGNTLAGVVGGGASKLQALHKWFKGDSFDGKDFSKKRNELSELASVSVRDLVKAIGGPISNGNESTPPHQSRSSSPVAVPIGRYDQLSAHGGSCSKSIEISDSSILVSSLAKDLSQSPSQSSFRDDAESYSFVDSHTSQTDEKTAQTVRTINFSNTPKHSPRKMRNKRSVQGYFCNNSTSLDTKENDQHAGKKSFSFSGEQNKSSLRDQHNDINNTANADAGRTAKRALPSSLAESLRAVFAAFLWHEGIVHDAMACSSFLKFHPTLPKNGAFIKNPSVSSSDKVSLSKEQRAQQRYSVEVANAGNYLNIRPSTLETLTKSGNSSIHNRRYRKNGTEEQPKLHALPELLMVCPPALKCLVYLWDQLSSNCIQVVQSTASDLLKDIQSPQIPMNPNNDQNISDDSKKNKKKKKDDGTWCELCEIFLPIPVTYHMRIVHSGCGKPAKGKGYNSVGTFCEGWAGNCGEGGKGASSWYLMCDRCREKYMVRFININNINTTTAQAFPPNNKIENLFGVPCNMILNSEVYSMMKENSMFLLELSSTGSGGMLGNQKRSPQQMPVVTETQLHQIASDLNKPSTSRGDINSSARNSKVMLAYNCSKDSAKGPASSTPYRRSDVPSCFSPELLWQAPDTFSCLESLGASMTNDTPYTIFGLNSTDNGFERPLSEISIDSMERSGILSNSITNTNSLSRFHRSMSMGQGWPNQSITSKYMQSNNDSGSGQNSKVILRRRNNSTCDDGGSLLLCHPSENLRKLVPESVFQVNCSVPVQTKIKPEVGLQSHENGECLPNTKDNCAAKSKISSVARNENSPSSSADVNRKASKSDAQPYKSNNIDQNICLLSRPTMVFIMEQHNLEKLRYSLKRSLRVATARIYSLQALNWLMRSVTQTSCLHDLMWWFVSSLKPAALDDVSKIDETEQALEHPVSSTQMCGKISLLLTQSFHTFLQTVADLTLLLPPGSALQQIAIQCFGIKFRQADHQFLHRSHVFGNISKILSRSDEQNEEMLLLSSAAMLESNPNFWIPHLNVNHETRVSNLVDLAGMFEVTVSSRQTMIASLTDGSTETFWESDEEDRNKSKIIEISMNKLSFLCKMIFVHIDNSRDIQNKVTNVSFYAGQSLGDTSLVKSVEVDSKSGTWISTGVRDDSWTHFRLEFRGSENTLRVRQIKLLGVPALLEEIHQRHNPKLTNAFQIQQRNCEAETLRVFRLITAQVFGKLILGADHHAENVNLVAAAGCMESSATSLLADSLDLREHMVGILFSRSKLSHLQKQVIVHIVHAIRKETQRAKEEWEILNATTNANNIPLTNIDEKSDSSSESSRAPDTYCFEMLSMVLALSGSTVGRSYLSHQYSLLKDLLSLLHTGSDRVQRQVTLLLRRILPEITPDNLADILGIRIMPPNDFSIVNQSSHTFDMNRLGIIDIFLAVIAKALQLQIKIKTVVAPTTNKQITTAKLCNCIDLNVYNLKHGCGDSDRSVDEVTEHLFDFGIGENSTLRNLNDEHCVRKGMEEKNLNQLWFMKGSISVKQAENIISIIRDMAGGKFSDKWSLVTKAAIAESILNLTRLDEVFRTNENCVKTATLWLALASLCVLDKDHVDRLSSGRWSKSSETRPLCSNHDDGMTPAVIQCEVCGSLCGDCDRFLHLNRKTRNHHRTLCKEEEEAIRVELHESCGRTKLFWLLALADSKTLKAMVEFRDGNNAIISGPSNSIGRCRFCGVTGNSGLLAIGNVCADAQCQEHAANTCAKNKQCGHSCGGVANEIKCLPCLQLMCNDRSSENAEPTYGPKLTQDADDMCMICFVEALSCAPAIQLDCGHVFHYHCCKTVLQKRGTGPRISFGFSQCPICKIDIAHTLLNEVLEPIINLKNDVKRKAMMRLEYEGIMKTTDHKDLTQYAMDRYAYYVCFKCQKAYYGGEARCDAEMGDKYNPEELVCGGCSDVARAQMCPKHGTDFLEYKCRYCCSVAVFFCFGTTHFCDTCHDDFQRLTNIAKNKLPRCPAGPKAKQLMGDDCPLHVIHPPTGEEFALGCGICRNAQTF